MSAEALQENYWRLYRRLYSYSAIMKRMRGIPKGMDPRLRTFIVGTNLHYRGHVRRRITPGIV